MKHFPEIVKKVEGSEFMIGYLLQDVVSQMSSEAMAKEVEAFFSSHKTTGFERQLAQTIEVIRSNAQYLERIKADAVPWLLKRFEK